jgi:hypothetical protein
MDPDPERCMHILKDNFSWKVLKYAKTLLRHNGRVKISPYFLVACAEYAALVCKYRQVKC